MIYNPVKLFSPVLVFVICLSLGLKSLWAIDEEECEHVPTMIQKVNEHIENWEKNGGTLSSIEEYFPDIKGILSHQEHNSLRPCPCLKSGEGSGNSGYSGAAIINCECEPKSPKVIKRFQNIEDGLKDFVYSLMAFRMHQSHGLGKELKMVEISDAVIYSDALSFVMERAQGADIHSFMNTADTRENVITACAQYLGTFHVGHLKYQDAGEVQATNYLAYAAGFYHKLCKKRTQSLQGQKGTELFELEIRSQRKDIKDFKSSRNIIRDLESEEDQATCIKFIDRTQSLFEQCSSYVYRTLNPCWEGTKRLYWTTITHGDAHRRNFFYNNLAQDPPTPEDSLERITMIDYSSIMETWGNIGDPAQDVGRFLGSLWDWASEAEGQEDMYNVIHELQSTFLDCYIKTVKSLLKISDDFDNIFIENCNFYKLRYYRAIFNSSSKRKTDESKMKLLKYWMREMEVHMSGPSSAFANSLLKEKGYYRERQPREWVPIEKTEQVIHNLPEKLTVFIESAHHNPPSSDNPSSDSYLNCLWKQLHGSAGAATPLQGGLEIPIANMGGIGKTSLALEYAHESLEKGAYNLIWWLCSEEPLFLKQEYEDILVKTRGFAEAPNGRWNLKQRHENMLVKTGISPNRTNSWRKEDQKNEENSLKRLKTRIESYVESHKFKWLLIYDNATDLANLKGLIPQHKNIHVLVTSRNQKGCEHPFYLDVFSSEDSVNYLFKKTGLIKNDENENMAKEVAKNLGHLPGALSAAANYVKLIGGENVNASHFREFFENFDINPNGTQNPITDPEGLFERLVGKTYRILDEQPSDVNQHAKNIMVLCAYLNPDLISENIFLGTAEDQGKTIKALKQLYDLSFIKRVKKGSFSINPLVHRLIQNDQTKQKTNSPLLVDVSNKIETLFYKYVSDESDSDTLGILTLLPHVFKLLENPKSNENHSLRWIGRILCTWYNRPYQYAYEPWRVKQTGKFESVLPKTVVKKKEGNLLKANPEHDITPDNWIVNDTHPKIYNTLGLMYVYGNYGLKKDPTKGRQYLKKSFEKGDRDAPFHIGELYENGWLGNDKPNYMKAKTWYEKAAALRNSFAMTNIGRLYEKGFIEGSNPNYVEAMKWYQKATDLGNRTAMTYIGKLYENGFVEGSNPNYVEAMKWYQEAKDATAMVDIGRLYENRRNYQKAMECYQEAAKLRNAIAMTNIGRLYENGWGVGRNYQKAMACYQKAAELENTTAMTHIGKLYEKGLVEGSKPNYVEAMKWYKKAAALRNSFAMTNIGRLYENDLVKAEDDTAMTSIDWQSQKKRAKGSKPNYVEAMKWYKKAATLENSFAMANIGRLYEKGLVKSSKHKYEEAMKWYKKAGDTTAMTNIGRLYQNVENNKKAMECYQEAAKLGNTTAMTNIGWLYQKSRNNKKAVEWYQKAADLGNSFAMNNIGWLYENGWGVRKSYQEAMEWYKKAAALGNSFAMNNIGRLYENGWGVHKSRQEAGVWRQKATKCSEATKSYKKKGKKQTAFSHDKAKGVEEMPCQEILATAQLAAGVLPFFDNGKTVLLGQEYRKRDNSYAWMEFGGKKEKNETLAETACREANEETAQTLRITLRQVQLAEQDGHYVDHYNEKTNILYRMYCLKFEGEKPILETFRENAKGNEHVEKIEWHYFDTFDVVYNRNGILPETEVQLYSTMQIRLKKLESQKFFPIFINELAFQKNEEFWLTKPEGNLFLEDYVPDTSMLNQITMPKEELLFLPGEQDLKSIKQESLKTVKEKIGSREIPGWVLEDVEPYGNCFYDAVAHQMKLIKHRFLEEVPEGTLPRDSLRLCVQEGYFKDEEWAEQEHIDELVKKIDVILAIVDTRNPQIGYVYYWYDGDEIITKSPEEENVSLPDKPIIKLAATGDHFLSVISEG